MGLTYSAEFSGSAQTLARDIFEITAPSDAVVRILSCRIGQSTDEADAEAEMLLVQIQRYTSTDGDGSSITPRPHHVGYPAAGSTVRGPGTEGVTKTDLLSEPFNVQAGWLYQPTPEEWFYLSPSGKLAIFVEAPADSLTYHGTLTFEEIGG